MRIKTFGKFIENIAKTGHKLNDSTLVIDGQNILYQFYAKTGLQFVFGSESNIYAEFLREYLSMFKKANVKCYFIFKGGHVTIEKKFKTTSDTDKVMGYNFDFGAERPEHYTIVQPIFMKDIYSQVLDEMGFDYAICQFESKKEIIGLAQKLNCPVLSHDIEYLFSGVPYILHPTLEYNEDQNVMSSSIITLDMLEKKFRLTDPLLCIFIVLTDIQIFPENHFLPFIKALRIPLGNYKRNIGILEWLSRTTRDKALEYIFKFTSSETKATFLEEVTKAKNMVRRQEATGLPTEYLLNGKVQILEQDPMWFEKGVVLKHIALPYINLYCSNIVLGSWAIADKEADDAILPSLKIIKYAYNLLTNYKKEEITLHKEDLSKTESIPVTGCVQKPKYDAVDSPFENGWDQLKSLGLFKHFIKEVISGFDFERLVKLPENAKLLVISLVYYYHQSPPTDVSNHVCSLLLCYAALTVSDNNDMINSHDRQVALNILATYFKEVTMKEAEKIFDPKMIQPLVEFQHCLQHMNYLNRLCGCPYMPTVYEKTFNGTFVYQILYTIEKDNDGNCIDFLNKLLTEAPTFLVFLKGLIDMYEKLI